MKNVFFTDFHSTPRKNLFKKIEMLLNKAGIEEKIKKNDITAVKIHFGEMGNHSFIRPVFVKKIIEYVKKIGGKPFLTDTTTLYTGSRTDAVSHIETAIKNGFAYSVVNAPIIIADGLRGNASSSVIINKEIFKEVSIAHEIVNADAIVALTHFTGHELSGFGGAIKNIGMGCATRKGKLEQHSNVSPFVKKSKCVGCKKCIEWCRYGAISIVDKKAQINSELCVGCGECILTCPENAIMINWNETSPVFQKKMAEYAFGVIKGKENSSLFVNFLNNITSHCDCYPMSDKTIIEDIGILASSDPVAIDQASIDLINKATKKDLFREIYPNIDYTYQLIHGEKIALGKRMYKIIKVE